MFGIGSWWLARLRGICLGTVFSRHHPPMAGLAHIHRLRSGSGVNPSSRSWWLLPLIQGYVLIRFPTYRILRNRVNPLHVRLPRLHAASSGRGLPPTLWLGEAPAEFLRSRPPCRCVGVALTAKRLYPDPLPFCPVLCAGVASLSDGITP